MQNKTHLLILLFSIFLFGCSSALMQTRRENQETQLRLNEKNKELQTLQDQNQYLLSEKERLSADLDQKSMTLNELNARLAELKAENSKIKAITLADKKKKANAQQRLDEYSKKIDTLSNDNQLGVQEKKKKIEALKQQIRKYLLQ